jgi:DnaK suppressor protein
VGIETNQENLVMAALTTPRTDLDLDHFRQLLQQERERLQGELGELGERDAGGDAENEEPDLFQGMADQATDLFLREQDDALGASLRSELERIDHAMAKLGNGSYGYCERCGVSIPAERLELVPAAEFCVPCAELI